MSQEKTVTKPAKLSLIADLQSAQKTRRREETEAGPECDKESRTDTEAETVRPCDEDVNKKNLKKVPFLVELENSKNKAKLRSNKSKTVAPPKNMEIGIQDQLRLKLEARKKLVDEADEERELEWNFLLRVIIPVCLVQGINLLSCDGLHRETWGR